MPMPMPTAAQCFSRQHANLEGNGRCLCCAVRNAVTRTVVRMAANGVPRARVRRQGTRQRGRALTPFPFPTSLLTVYSRASSGASSAATTHLSQFYSGLRRVVQHANADECLLLFIYQHSTPRSPASPNDITPVPHLERLARHVQSHVISTR